MYYAIFILIALLAGVAVFFGFTKAQLWAFLFGAGLITLLGVIAINEGLALGSVVIWTDDSGYTQTAAPQILTATSDMAVFIIGWSMFYGGIVLSALGLIVAMIPFYNLAKNYS